MQGRSIIALGIVLTCCSSAFALNPSLDINQYAHTAWTARDGFFKGTNISIAQTPDGYPSNCPTSGSGQGVTFPLERADEAIAEDRTAVYDLRSSTTTNDLAQAIRAPANELATEGSTTFRLVVEGNVREQHPIIRDELYRISRKASLEEGRPGHYGLPGMRNAPNRSALSSVFGAVPGRGRKSK